MNTQTLTGIVQRILFTNSTTGWTVLRLSPNNRSPGFASASRSAAERTRRGGRNRRPKNDTVTVVGTLPDPHPGETLELKGQWETHPQYGRQFEAEYCQVARPDTVEGIERYLGSSLIGGVGPVTAGRIVEHFGLQTLDILDEQPERLAEVPGVGPKRAASIAASWAEQKAIEEVMIFLAGIGVTTGLAVKIYKAYGDEAIGTVQRNPYRLALDIRGIGFKQADRIARSLGLPLDSPERYQVGLAYALEQAANLGHVYLPQPELAAQAAELLAAPPNLSHVPPSDLRRAVEALVEGYRAKRETVEGDVEAVYLPAYYYAEAGVAERLAKMIAEETSRLAPFARIEDWEGFLASLVADGQVELTDRQHQAVRAALTHKVTVITGGPGTGTLAPRCAAQAQRSAGETTTMQAVINALEAQKATYSLAAPTGRAAKRLSEACPEPVEGATGRQA